MSNVLKILLVALAVVPLAACGCCGSCCGHHETAKSTCGAPPPCAAQNPPPCPANPCPAELRADADRAIADAKAADPSLDCYFQNSAGYAVFPKVGKGGLVVGGAHGKGVLYEHGTPTACADMTQATVGAQAGGQEYSEIIFFETQDSLNRFKQGKYTTSAQASAVALQSGAASNARYEHGVAIFTWCASGMMAEASVGGQKFTIYPMRETGMG